MNRWDPYRAVPVVFFADPSEGPPYYVPYYDKQGDPMRFVCLFGVLRPTPELRRHHYQWRASNFDLYSVLMAIEKWGSFSVPYLLWHGTSFYNGILRGPVTPVAKYLPVELSLLVFTTWVCQLIWQEISPAFLGDTFVPWVHLYIKYKGKVTGRVHYIFPLKTKVEFPQQYGKIINITKKSNSCPWYKGYTGYTLIHGYSFIRKGYMCLVI